MAEGVTGIDFLDKAFNILSGGFEKYLDFERFDAELSLAKNAQALEFAQLQSQAPQGSVNFATAAGAPIPWTQIAVIGGGAVALFFVAKKFLK